MKKLILVTLLCLLPSTLTEETYENSSHICERCKCTDGDVFTLDCASQGFEHVLANWPPHNKTLVATFSYNNITTLEILPITDQKAKLVFDHCNIHYLDVGVFSHMKNVLYIDLSYNLLTTAQIDGQDFKGPYNKSVYYPIATKHLNLAYNQIHSLPRKFFESVPDLEELNLEGNDFTILDVATQTALSTLKKLKVLNLANNELTELVGDPLKSLENMEDLDLSNNHLDFVPETLDYVGKTLKILKLSNNKIFELGEESFSGLHLVQLYLDNLPSLEYIKPNTFSGLTDLKKLSLSHNMNLKVIDRQAFSPKQRLIELNLNNNSLTVLKFELLNWTSLRVFQVDENPLECSCDLWNISQALDASVKKTLNGPYCCDIWDGQSKSIFTFNDDICTNGGPAARKSKIERHFAFMRAIIIILTLMLTTGAMVALALGYLRYRRGVAFRNYPFTAQVSYVPVGIIRT